jgi:hypothetical protein
MGKPALPQYKISPVYPAIANANVSRVPISSEDMFFRRR